MNFQKDAAFVGPLPKVYGEYLVPIFFEPYANDIADRLKKRKVNAILETATGTGVVTRAIDEALPKDVRIVATDLNMDMLEQASIRKVNRNIEWKQANAQELPFGDETFDAVICQFGVMFFPDKPKAYAEAFRVLKPGGVFIFNVWDDIAENDFSNMVSNSYQTLFPNDPPDFLRRTPYAYYNEKTIEQHLSEGGFKNKPSFETISFRTKAPNAETAAMSICFGTPLRNDIENHGASYFGRAIDMATATIIKRLGNVEVEGKLQAKIFEVVK